VLEEQIESADVAMDFYGVMVSPGTRKICAQFNQGLRQ
jgi:hypothetical protein